MNLPEEGRATVYRVSIVPQQRTRISYHRLAEEYYTLHGLVCPISFGVEKSDSFNRSQYTSS